MHRKISGGKTYSHASRDYSWLIYARSSSIQNYDIVLTQINVIFCTGHEWCKLFYTHPTWHCRYPETPNKQKALESSLNSAEGSSTWSEAPFHTLQQKKTLEFLKNMVTLQLQSSRALDPSSPPLLHGCSSSFWGGRVSFIDGRSTMSRPEKLRSNGGTVRILAMSNSSPSFKMNLNEYMVTLDKPLGIRFALSVDGKIFVHSLKKGVFPSFLSFRSTKVQTFWYDWFCFSVLIGLFVFLNSIFQGNAEKSRIVMVGDTLKKAGDSSGGRLLEAKDFGDTQYAINILHFIISLNEFWIKCPN